MTNGPIPVASRFSFNQDDLTNQSSTQSYPLGFQLVVADPTNSTAIKKFTYIKALTSLTAYAPYQIVNSATSGYEVTAASPVKVTSTVNTTGAAGTVPAAVYPVGIPQIALTSGYYGFVQTQGLATYLSNSVANAAGINLRNVQGQAYLVTDTTGGLGSAEAWGRNMTTLTTGVSVGTIYLNGNIPTITTV